ncbi:hypothetical protein EsVE80_13330 [Enterococcus saigonensis]|uniref:Uncharacterized protein n=1 Tax=Enterococcus saigonensis TaxID=1805431 RepID=A0A679IBY8_9ENTE|nr:SPJ_0845 family protein [Enterococcus saigonensis]BCA85810.1 hypothetical protein EsVE80_13330 [Enterococcus saigonensis]
MGLKFERDDSLDKMFDDLVILPDKKEEVDISRFLKPEAKKEQNKKSKKTESNQK